MFRHINNIFLSLILFLLSDQALSQGTSVDKATIETLKIKVKEISLSTKTIASDFKQIKEMQMLNETITSNGKFYFKKEKNLRWEYSTPFSYVIIIRNDQIFIRDENKVNQFNLKSNKVFLEVNRIILGSIQGTLLNDEQNFRTVYFVNPTHYIARLKTLNSKLSASLSEINIYFDRKDYSVSRIELMEPGGDKTLISFFNKSINKPIDDQKFLVP